jgi:hypothetical protein
VTTHPYLSAANLTTFKQILLAIRASDPSYGADETDYGPRNTMILSALGRATELGFKAGIKPDPENCCEDWVIVYIELPTGQVSWHLPAHEIHWDGHTTEKKYDRIKEFAS